MIINLHKLVKYIYTILYIFCKITLISSLCAQNKSYFFTNEQSNAIFDKLNNKNKIKKKRNKKKITEYKLSGICYLSIYNWVVWINGQSYNKIGQYSQFSIDEVTPDSVTITTLDCKTIHLTVKCDNTCIISNTNENSNCKSINVNNVIANRTTNKTVNDINNMDINNTMQNNNTNNVDNNLDTTSNVINNSTNNNTTQNNNIDNNSNKKNVDDNNNTKNTN